MKKLLLGLTLAAAVASPALAQSYYGLSGPQAPNTAWADESRGSYAYEPAAGMAFDSGATYGRGWSDQGLNAYGSLNGPAGMPRGGANAPYVPPYGSEY